MNKLIFDKVNMSYGKIKALDEFTLNISKGEFIVILGTSGSGKTTLLRIVAGLETLYEGEILIDDKDLKDIDIIDRKVALVFQNYALYPQMTAYQNLVLALRQRVFYLPVLDKEGNQEYIVDKDKINQLKIEIKNLKRDNNYKSEKNRLKEEIKNLKKNPSVPYFDFQRLPDDQIEQRLEEIDKILDLSPFFNQRTSTLSGGQKQRVALGKALLKEPDILLLDEPLSNLDAKLKSGSRELIKSIHNITGCTTIMTSHDVFDATYLADRVVVLDEGKLLQVDTPINVYEHPLNITVAKFFANPSINLLEGVFDGENFVLDESSIAIPLTKDRKELLIDYINKKLILGVRPENIILTKDNPSFNLSFERSEIYGRDFLHHLWINEVEVLVRCKDKIKEGTTNVGVQLLSGKILFFDKITSRMIGDAYGK